MGLSNAAKRARNYGQTINQNQGGGDKKAGFPYQVGRTMWSAVALGTIAPPGPNSRCCSLQFLRLPLVSRVRQSRPTGGLIPDSYWS